MTIFFLNAFAKIINQALNLDPASAIRLVKLNGKILCVEILPLHLTFQCQFHKEGVSLHQDGALPWDTKITGTPLQLLSVMLNQNNRQRFFSEDVTIQGDMEIGQAAIHLFDQLEMDWETQLADLLGDVPAYHAANRLRQVKSWLKYMRQECLLDIKDYIHEEAVLLPTREALQVFLSDIDHLRMDVDRMTIRIAHLKHHIASETSP